MGGSLPGVAVLPGIAKFFKHIQYFLEINATTSMPKLVFVNGDRQLTSPWRKLVVPVIELATFDSRRRGNVVGVAAVAKCRVGNLGVGH